MSGPLGTSSVDTRILQLHRMFSAAVPSHCNSGVCVVAAAAVKALHLLAEEVQTLDTATCSLIGKLLNVALERRRYTGDTRPVSTAQQQQTANPEQGNSSTRQKKREASPADFHQNTQHDSVQWSEEELLSFWGDVAQQQKATDGTDCAAQFKQAVADSGKGEAVKTVFPFSSLNEREATATDGAPAMRAQHRGSKDFTIESVSKKAGPHELSEALWHRYLASSSSSGEGGRDANGSALPDISSKMRIGQPDSLRVIPTTPAHTEGRRTSAAATTSIEIEKHLVSLQELLHRLLDFALCARQVVDTLRVHYNSTLTEQAGVFIAACPLLGVDGSSHLQVLPVGLSPTVAKPLPPAAGVTLTEDISVARTTASPKGIKLANAGEVLLATGSTERPVGVLLAKAGEVSIVSGLIKEEKGEKEKEKEEGNESTKGDRKRGAEDVQAAQEAFEDTGEHCSVSIRYCKVRNTEHSTIEASENTSTYCTEAGPAGAAERENMREQTHRQQNEKQQKKQSKLHWQRNAAYGHHQERGKEQQPTLVAEQQVQHEGHQGDVEPQILVQQQTHWQSPQLPSKKHSTQHQQQTHCQSPQVRSEKLSTQQQHHLQSPQLPYQMRFSQQQQEQQKRKRGETFCKQQELLVTEVQRCDASKKLQQQQKPHHLEAVANKQDKRCNHLFNLLQLCEVVVNTIEGDWRFKQEVKEELHFDAPLGVFRAAKAAWSAMPYVSDLAPLLQKAAAECSTGNQQQAAVLEGRDSYIYLQNPVAATHAFKSFG